MVSAVRQEDNIFVLEDRRAEVITEASLSHSQLRLFNQPKHWTVGEKYLEIVI